MKSDHKNLNHIAFIMDGNGRWAKERGKSRTFGHQQGVNNAKEIVLKIRDLKIPYLSLYTFSKENWKRPELEVKFLMDLLVVHFKKEFDFYIKNRLYFGEKDSR